MKINFLSFQNFKQANLRGIFTTFCFFYLITTFIRVVINSGTVNLLKQQGYILLSALSLLLVYNLFAFRKKIFVWFGLFWFLYGSVIFIKLADKMIILDREIVHTITFSTFLCGFILTTEYIAGLIKNHLLSKALKIISRITLICGLLLPLFVLGYFIVSGGHMLSADIILTLFQTNTSEIRSYLASQDLRLWIGSFIFIITFIWITFQFYLHQNHFVPDRKNGILLSCIFYIYIFFFVFSKLTSCFVLDLGNTVFKTLESFKVYEQTKEIRAQRLSTLQNILDQNSHNGIYILVVGESTTRDHMNAFGYPRLNTPWLTQISKNNHVLLFNNAYSNHVHTVPAVQYALSELNQYQSIPVQEAYSIIEVAKAAGFDTYWLSNQKQFNVSDTPLTTIAASANHQVWLNSYAGDKTMTTYYDDKLADQLPDLDKTKKALIIVHLMGCHSVYNERYPAEYDFFKDQNSRIDEYDNAVRYNDFVLEKLYNRLKDHPNFMAFIYFSDHGEDPDNGFTHEASKFTFPMSRIPLVIIFSDKFAYEHKKLFTTLHQNAQKYVTSDLIYNMMLSVLGIYDMPRLIPNMDISSPQYNMSKDSLLTVHGKKHISEDVQIKENPI